jgi:O-antigen/teichoic acid export membrane protein
LNVLSTPEIADHGYLVTPFMALGALFLGAYAIVAQVMTLEKNTALAGKIWIVAALLNLILSIVLVTYAGIIGGAIATLISFAFAFFAASYYAAKSISIPFHLSFIAKSLMASLVMSFMLYLLSPYGVAGLMFSIAAGAVVYFFILLALKGFSRDELYFIGSIR